MTIAAIGTLFMGGVAFAEGAAKTDPRMQKDQGADTDPGMTGTPPTAETPGVEGKSGSQSGAKPSDKMAPKQ
jgi:hypothetical protein